MTHQLFARCLAACLSAALCLSASGAGAGAGAADQYLYDVLKNKTYLNTWNKLVASRADAPAWLKAYGKTKNGPTTPAEPVTSGAITYEVRMVCKTHECGGNRFFVTFLDKGRTAYGLLIESNQQTLFGTPEPEIAAALKKAANLP